MRWFRTRRLRRLEREVKISRREKQARLERRIEIRKAYQLAKKELGEEPTVEQIFLTRDSMQRMDST